MSTFPFEDERYLRPGDERGGLVHRTHEGALGALPLLVYLHGTNEGGPLHRGLGAPGFDVRAIVDALALPPMLVAGPSQNRDAKSGSRLWPEFDLTLFVDAVEGPLPSGVSVDRERVILAGHSGAGCNRSGGILTTLGLAPFAILAIDTCLDVEFGRALAAAAERSRVEVFFQDGWKRDFVGFRGAFLETARLRSRLHGGSVTQVSLAGANAHEDIVAIAIARALPELLR